MMVVFIEISIRLDANLRTKRISIAPDINLNGILISQTLW